MAVMNIKYCVIYFFLLNVVRYASAECWFSKTYSGWQCPSMEDLPSQSTETWTKLTVFSCLHLKKDTFKNAPNLVYLQCVNIASMEEGTFNGLHKLEALRMHNVTLEEIPFGILDNLSIRELVINDSKLKNIQPGLLQKLPDLEKVEMIGNSISEIQKGVFGNTNIKTLLVRDTEIDKIADKAFVNMNKLVELSLSSNMLNGFNSESYFGTNNVLKKLFLAHNKLTKITKDMFTKMPELVSLDFYNNQIETVDLDSFKSLPKIEKVYFKSNNIKDVQKGGFDSTSIHELSFINNRIEKIAPKAFENMTKLTDLSLNGNFLNSFNSELLFGTSESLNYLWLANNSLLKITKDMFTTLPNLKQLNLEVNKIEAIEIGAFDKLPKLYVLDISNNKIKSIDQRIFPKSGMKTLASLTLHNNKLTFINQALLLRTPNLKYITYAGNPFQCPCHLQLKKYISKRNITRICDQDYLEGTRPVCVFSSEEPGECIYDEDLTDDLYEVYVEAVKDYPKLELSCDLTSFRNATLVQFEN